MRTCTQCGTVYAPDNQDAKCSMPTSGLAICGGDIQPPATIPDRPVNCLLCMDTGKVRSHATEESWNCPRGCKGGQDAKPA